MQSETLRSAGRCLSTCVQLIALAGLASLAALLWSEYCAGGVQHVLVYRSRTHWPRVSFCLPSASQHDWQSLRSVVREGAQQWQHLVVEDSCVLPHSIDTPHLTLPGNSSSVVCFTALQPQPLTESNRNCSMRFRSSSLPSNAFLLLHFHPLPLHTHRILAADSRELQLVRLPEDQAGWHLELLVDWRRQERMTHGERPCDQADEASWQCRERCSFDYATHNSGCVPNFMIASRKSDVDLPRCRAASQNSAFLRDEMVALDGICEEKCILPCKELRFNAQRQVTSIAPSQSNLSTIKILVSPGPTMELHERSAFTLEQLLAQLGGLAALLLCGFTNFVTGQLSRNSRSQMTPLTY